MKTMSLKLWKDRQNKKMKRRLQTRALVKLRRQHIKKCRMKRNVTSRGQQYTPMTVDQGILTNILHMIVREKMKKSQGQRGS